MSEHVPPLGPSWAERASFEILRCNERAQRAGHPGLSVADISRIHAFEPRERFLLLNHLWEGAIRNLRNRLHHRMTTMRVSDEHEWNFNATGSEDELSSDEFSDEAADVQHPIENPAGTWDSMDSSESESDPVFDCMVRRRE